MTDILPTTEHRNTTATVARIATSIAASSTAFLSSVGRCLILIPQAISTAAAMAYVDPFHLAGRDKDQAYGSKDHTDPRNF